MTLLMTPSIQNDEDQANASAGSREDNGVNGSSNGRACDVCSNELTTYEHTRMYVCVSDGCTANAPRFFCGYPSCNTASTTAAGVTIHQKRQHLDWMDAAVNAKTGASQRGKGTKVQWTEERSEDLAKLWNEVARETGASGQPDSCGHHSEGRSILGMFCGLFKATGQRGSSQGLLGETPRIPTSR